MNDRTTRGGLLSVSYPSRRSFVAALACLCVSLCFAACSNKVTDRSVKHINTEQASVLQRQSKGTLFIDVRPEAVFAAGHKPGAVNRRLSSLSNDRLDPELTGRHRLVVYGANPASGAALAFAKRLIEAGHSGVEFFEPGFDGWRAAGLPVER